MKKSPLLTQHPQATFNFINYLLKRRYADLNWGINDIYDCLRELNANGISKKEIQKTVEQYIFSESSADTAQAFINSLKEDNPDKE